MPDDKGTALTELESPAQKVATHKIPGPTLRANVTIINGDWRVEGKELIQSDAKAHSYFFFGDEAWTDYDVSLETKAVSGETGGKIFFRAANLGSYYHFAAGAYKAEWHEACRLHHRRALPGTHRSWCAPLSFFPASSE